MHGGLVLVRGDGEGFDQSQQSGSSKLPLLVNKDSNVNSISGLSLKVLYCFYNHLVSFVVQSIKRSLFDFEVQTKKSFRCFLRLNHQLIAVDFEAQTEKSKVTDFEVKLVETVDLDFEPKPKNPSQCF
jgi:hypothetical protein